MMVMKLFYSTSSGDPKINQFINVTAQMEKV